MTQASRLATFLTNNGRRVLAVAVVGAAVAVALGGSVAQHLSPYGADDPSSESVQAAHRFERASGRQIDAGLVALVRAGDVGTPHAKARVAQVAAQLRAQPGIARVTTAYTAHDPAMVARDRRSTYVLATFKPRSDRALQDDARTIQDRFAHQPDVTLGGESIASTEVDTQVGNDLAHAELLAFPFIFLLSLLFFRSLVAALVPPLLGALAIVATFLALRVLASFADISVFALNLVTGLALGLAIDYSLFMVSRYREEAAATGFGAPALGRTLQTAGRTIVFSALTIAAATASLMIFPQRFLYSMGIAGALVALLAATLALTVLPALLAVLGPRINALAPRRLARAADRDARPDEHGGWYRFSRFVLRRPAPIAIATATLLIVLGLPFTGIRFTQADASVLPAGAGARQVDDALERDFPPNRTAPLEVVAGAPAASPEIHRLARRLATLPDVAAVAPPQAAGPGLTLLAVAPRHGPLTGPTKDLVRRVRALDEPYSLQVAGRTASLLDLERSLAAHVPAVLAVVVGATLLILFLMTGSVVLPIKAVLMNVLNLSAVFGILVLVFQHGHLEGLLGYRGQGALDATQPVLLFAIGFGLSTDYGVLLLSRIKEAHDAGSPNSEAVAIGLERTGRIVTAAALLFAVAIAAFATSKIVFIKELGVGTALAVLIDATIVRALLVPSLMGLLGAANWWAPKTLRRVYDRLPLPAGSHA